VLPTCPCARTFHVPPHLRRVLNCIVLAVSQLLENSPHDFFWGGGWDASGANHLGRLLMRVREQLLTELPDAAAASAAAAGHRPAEPHPPPQRLASV